MCYGTNLPITGGRCFYENYNGECTKGSKPCPVELEEEEIMRTEKEEEEEKKRMSRKIILSPSDVDLDYVSELQKTQVAHLVTGLNTPEQYNSVQELIKQCFNPPGWSHKTLTALNEIIEGHGVEAIWLTEDKHRTPDYEYINQGDPYVPTIMYDCCNGDFFIAAWGDILEEHQEESGVV
jgi:hypothetical protein